MIRRARFLAVGAYIVFSFGPAVFASDISSDLATAVFAEAQDICEADAGNLWGVSLCGPVILVEPATREAVASVADSAGVLDQDGVVFRGTLPDNVPVANTAMVWGDTRWTMLMWPLSDDVMRRRALLAHEMWHGIQDEIGLPASGDVPSHLDEEVARTWIRLEWRALSRALRTERAERRQAIGDALAFRQMRAPWTSAESETERQLELNEGLAAYTGIKLAHGTGAIPVAQEILASGEERVSFTRTAAYVSGPALGLLLDAVQPEWRTTVTPATDLTAMLAAAYSVTPSDADAAAQRYGADEIRSAEADRAQITRARIVELENEFVHGPVLRLPIHAINMSFDPNQVEALGEHGTIYGGFEGTDEWGRVIAPEGVLITSDFTVLVVPNPTVINDAVITGPEWNVELAPEWHIEIEGTVWRAAQASH